MIMKNKNFTAGLCYLVGCATVASGYLAGGNQTMTQQDNNDDNINFYTSPENMFPIYVSYRTENRKEDDGKEYQDLLNLYLAAYSLLLIFQKKMGLDEIEECYYFTGLTITIR